MAITILLIALGVIFFIGGLWMLCNTKGFMARCGISYRERWSWMRQKYERCDWGVSPTLFRGGGVAAIIIVGIITASLLLGGESSSRRVEAEECILNPYLLHKEEVSFYTKVPREVESFSLSIFDQDAHLAVDVYDPDGEWICREKDFTTRSWYVITVPVNMEGIYRIMVDGQPYADGIPGEGEGGGNRFWLRVSTDNLYSDSLYLNDERDARLRVKVPQHCSKFCLLTYDMDSQGLIYVTDPDGGRIGPFKPSEDTMWREIYMPTYDKSGYWTVDFEQTKGAGSYGVYASELNGVPLELHVQW
jgi:hypothetical protein